MTESGRVLDVKDGDALVVFRRNAACAGCKACSMGANDEMRVKIKNSLNAKTGDTVEVELEAKRLLSAGMWAYLFPLAMVFIGLGTGYMLAPAIGTNRDITAALASLLMLGVSFVILKLLNRRFAAMPGYSPRMKGVIPAEKQGVDKNGFGEPEGI